MSRPHPKLKAESVKLVLETAAREHAAEIDRVRAIDAKSGPLLAGTTAAIAIVAGMLGRLWNTYPTMQTDPLALMVELIGAYEEMITANTRARERKARAHQWGVFLLSAGIWALAAAFVATGALGMYGAGLVRPE